MNVYTTIFLNHYALVGCFSSIFDMLILFYWYRLVSSILQLILDLTDGGVEDPVEVLERIRLESVGLLLEPLPLVELIVPDAFNPFRIDRIPEKLENGFQLQNGIR